MDNRLQVTICGGGNTAHFSAAIIGANKNITVNIYTRKPLLWKKTIIATTKNSYWEHKGTITGNLKLVSDNPEAVCKGTKIFIICAPANSHENILRNLSPYLENNSYIGTVYGQGGFDMCASYVFGKDLTEKNITLFGLQNVPSICKITKYGESVRVIGPKKLLYSVASPVERKNEVCRYMEILYNIPAISLPNFMCITLTPSNQIIHPGRIYGIFRDWDGKTPFKEEEIPLIYEDMDDFSADCMQILDDEIQLIKSKIEERFPDVDLSTILPLKERVIRQYGTQIKDTSSLRTVFSTNLGYSTVRIPIVKVPGGVLLDVNSRFFWEDVPYGLIILKDIARLLGLQTPGFDKMIEWHQQYMGKEYIKNGKINKDLIPETGSPSRYGLQTIEELLKLSRFNAKL